VKYSPAFPDCVEPIEEIRPGADVCHT